MPTLEYFLISEGVSVDQRTNRLSIFNIFENVNADDFPVNVPLVIAVVSLIKEDEDQGKDFQLLLKIHSPEEKKAFEFSMNFIMERDQHRLLLNVDNLKIKAPGIITFEIYLNGDLLTTRMVNVNLNHSKTGQL